MFFNSRTKTFNPSSETISADFSFISDNEEDPINDEAREQINIVTLSLSAQQVLKFIVHHGKLFFGFLMLPLIWFC